MDATATTAKTLDVLTVPEAAKLTGISSRTLRRRIADGSLLALQPSRRYLIRRRNLFEFLRDRIVVPTRGRDDV